jgi:hypothetical protein
MDELLKRFDKTMFFTSVASKIPFDMSQGQMVKNLEVAKGLLGRGEIHFNPQTNRLDLSDPMPPEEARTFEIAFLEGRAVTLLLGGGYDENERRALYEHIWPSLIERANLFAEAIEHIEKRLELTLLSRTNPWLAACSVFAGSGLERIVRGTRVYRCRPALLYSMDPEGKVVCRVDINSDISTQEVDAGNVASEKKLNIRLDVGRVSDFRLEDVNGIPGALVRHVDTVRQYLKEAFYPKVLFPLLEAVDAQRGQDDGEHAGVC